MNFEKFKSKVSGIESIPHEELERLIESTKTDLTSKEIKKLRKSDIMAMTAEHIVERMKDVVRSYLKETVKAEKFVKNGGTLPDWVNPFTNEKHSLDRPLMKAFSTLLTDVV